MKKGTALAAAPNEKVGIVTGAASGIGLGIAERLARDGVRVALFDLDGDQAETAAAKIRSDGGRAMAVRVDVADRQAVADGIDRVREHFGPVTVLVNNAGKEGFRRFLDISPEKWEEILAVNLTGTFHCCQLVLPDMIAAGWGRIVNISSSSVHGGQQFMAHYVASKTGVVGLTKSLALEFGSAGITVNTIPPGFIDTPMTRRNDSKGRLGPGGIDEAVSRTPVGRAGLPEDIAATCAFLVSEEAGYITGQIIGVNGGRNT
jgi:2-hydroxycyclohexanecarboxyl-CoA dehydrogenase